MKMTVASERARQDNVSRSIVVEWVDLTIDSVVYYG